MRALWILGLALAVIGLGGWLEIQRFQEQPLVPASGPAVALEIPRGMSLTTLANTLTAQGLLEHPYYFLMLAHWRGDAARLKAGEYALEAGLTPAQLLDLLVSGRVVQHALTLVEGWTIAQALQVIAADSRLRRQLEEATPEALMQALGHPEMPAEGRFFPDTYYFVRGASDLEVLRRAFATMERVLAEEWAKRDPEVPLSRPYEALILASLIEKETGQAAERPTIAGVFIRRLRQGMRLQTDPTVIYGLGEAFDGNLRRADLRRDTPYNTYVHGGLPPTPIALPGRAALHAALHPEPGNSLYFVAKGDGSHWFSATLEEHNRAVRRYQLGQQAAAAASNTD